MNAKVLLLTVLVSLGAAGADERFPWCPLAGEIFPCSCTYASDLGIPDLYCHDIDSLEQLMDIFYTATFPYKHFWRIRLSFSNLGDLPADVFNDVGFEEVRLTTSNITSVHPDAFRASLPFMDTLELYSNALTDDTFPWSILGDYPKLWRVHLHHNNFENFPVLESEALEDINLWDTPITSVTRDMVKGAPNLRIINVSPHVDFLAEDTFLDLSNLQELHFNDNQLGNLSTNAFVLNSTAFAYLYLNNNSISNIHSSAITGLMSDRLKLFLENNNLTTLKEEVFRPLMDHMVDGWGELEVAGNPLVCDCELFWLLSNSTLLANVRTGECDDGTPLEQVDISEWLC